MGSAGQVAPIIPRRLPDGQRDYSASRLQVRLVLDGRNEAAPEPVVLALRSSTPTLYAPRLNGTELGILACLSNGKCVYEVALLMEMSDNAVYQHCHRIYDKLGANTAAGAVGRALRLGLIK